MNLKERDIDILTTIFNLHFLTTSQIHSIHGYSGEYGRNVTRRKLKQLEDAGYLHSWQPSKYDQKIFYLTKNGAQEVSLHNGYATFKTFKRSNTTLHQVMVSEVYAHLKSLKLGRLRRFTLNQKVGEAIADAFIEYQVNDSSVNNTRVKEKRKLIFLEADRGTETLQHIIEKITEYQKASDSGEFQKQFGIFPEVAFITSSEARKRAILRAKTEASIRVRVLSLDEFISHPEALISI